MENPDFLKKKYDLHKSEEVEKSAVRAEKRTGEKSPQDPEARIQNYLNRFKEITEREDEGGREMGMEAIKKVLHKENIIKPEDIPEGYWEHVREVARQRGQGADLDQADWETIQEQNTEAIIADQKASLDNWIDYLASPDATYPDWLKYWAIRSVLKMGKYDKEEKRFNKRSKGTIDPFADLNREALAYVLDAVEEKYKQEDINLNNLDQENQQELQKLLNQESFPKLYSWAIEQVTPADRETLKNTEGQWIKYDQSSNHMPLVESIQGHGTGWCTAGESTAETQLKGGDFYIYYSYDKNNQPTIPRVAIRMEGDSVAEVRGIAEEQNLDEYIAPVVGEKLQEFGQEGEKYQKKTEDMNYLTEIEKKTKENQSLTKEDLTFLYELDSQIEGFGYHRDPRVEELRENRNPEEDMLTIFECSKDQIASNPNEINETTEAYLGSVEKNLFDKAFEYNIEHLYTSFPEKRIEITKNFEVQPITLEEFKQQAEEYNKNITDESQKIKMSSYVEDMMRDEKYYTLEKPEKINLVKLTVFDLFHDNQSHTVEEIYSRAKELGLDLCPPETGLSLRLLDTNQPMGEYYRIAMNPLSDRDGNPDVFRLNRGGDGFWLSNIWTSPDDGWNPDDAVVFRKFSPKL